MAYPLRQQNNNGIQDEKRNLLAAAAALLIAGCTPLPMPQIRAWLEDCSRAA